MASKSITLREWQATLEHYLERMHKPGKADKDVEKIEDWFAERTNEALRMPVRSLEDLVTLAAIAVHWNEEADQPYPQWVIDGDPAHYIDRRTLAYVIKGILDLAGGVRFDSEGRLQLSQLSQQAPEA